MARRKKGTWGISDEKPKEIKKALPEWSAPRAEDVFEGMTLGHLGVRQVARRLRTLRGPTQRVHDSITGGCGPSR